MDDPQVLRPTRVALVGLPRLVEDLVATLVENWAEFEVCARIEAGDDLLAQFSATAADIVVCAVPEATLTSSWARVLRATSMPAVVNLVDGERAAAAYYLCPRRADAPDVEAESLRAVLRGCCITADPVIGP